MIRYIKFDDAVKIMACEMYAEAQSQGYDVDGIEDFMPEAKAWITDAPSIDIVRCSECVYCNVQNTKYLYAICERHGIEFKPFEDDTRTHGCAWGISRSEKPNNSKVSEKPTGSERSSE